MSFPTVTEEDLRAFHAKHFTSAPAPPAFFQLDDTPVQAYEEAEDDDLGYYSDGVKRTLTDEQIAIFRHSEIQAIIRELRERRQAQEGHASSGGSTPTSQESDPRLKRSMADFTPYGEGNPKRKKLDLSGLAPRKNSNKRLPLPEPEAEWEDIEKMRAWQPEMTWEDSKKSPSDSKAEDTIDRMPRRMAREEDDLRAEDIVLDY